MTNNPKIAFMGTPDFAVESLRAIVENGYNVVGVVTVPDKPAGRGQKLQASAVKNYAVEQDLPLLQPSNLKDEEFLAALKAWNADLFVVVAFRMLPEVVWSMPRLGTFNLHASLLPQYRGAAPINWAVINGERETGVTTFFITHGMDTGNLLFQEKVTIEPTDNAGSVHDKLMRVGGKLVLKTIDKITIGEAKAQPQVLPDNIHHAPKIFKETCRIDWNQPAEKVHNLIRGLSPYPAAFTELALQSGETIPVKVFESNFEVCTHHLAVGKIITDKKSELKIVVPDGFVYLRALQPAGKKAMPASDFLRGYRLQETD